MNTDVADQLILEEMRAIVANMDATGDTSQTDRLFKLNAQLSGNSAIRALNA